MGGGRWRVEHGPVVIRVRHHRLWRDVLGMVARGEGLEQLPLVQGEVGHHHHHHHHYHHHYHHKDW